MTISRKAIMNFVRVFTVVLTFLLVQRKGRPAVHLETFLGFIAAHGPFFAIADGHDPVWGNALRDQVLFDGICTPVAQTEVVLFASTFVAIAFNSESNSRIGFQP